MSGHPCTTLSATRESHVRHKAVLRAMKRQDFLCSEFYKTYEGYKDPRTDEAAHCGRFRQPRPYAAKHVRRRV